MKILHQIQYSYSYNLNIYLETNIWHGNFTVNRKSPGILKKQRIFRHFIKFILKAVSTRDWITNLHSLLYVGINYSKDWYLFNALRSFYFITYLYIQIGISVLKVQRAQFYIPYCLIILGNNAIKFLNVIKA